jgi:NADPH:quinone reductase-like Zn-dependent oxidoreductase
LPIARGESRRPRPAIRVADCPGLQGRRFLRAIVDSAAPLAEGVAAQQRLADGKQFGKIVLVP